MLNGKPPWSEIHDQVSALFIVAASDTIPKIPEHASEDAKDFLLKCLQRDPKKRPNTVKLLQHSFILGSGIHIPQPKPTLNTSNGPVSGSPSNNNGSYFSFKASPLPLQSHTMTTKLEAIKPDSPRLRQLRPVTPVEPVTLPQIRLPRLTESVQMENPIEEPSWVPDDPEVRREILILIK
jgi:serine/threonine protein kinase